MEAHGIVPTIIDKVPPNSIEVKYDSGVQVDNGKELTPTQVKDVPKLAFPANASDFHTVIMIDPDTKFGTILHWLVINVPGSDVSKGFTIAGYVGSGPPEGTGLHRYIFLVYKQPKKFDTAAWEAQRKEKSVIDGRRDFKLRESTQKYELGEPIAGNFYQAKYDDYVPILHAKMAEAIAAAKNA